MKNTLTSIIRFLFVALFFCGSSPLSWAQMSDTEIMSFVKEQTEAGVSQTQIARQLVARGVSVQKLQNLKDQYENLESEDITTEKVATATPVITTRERVANGEIPQEIVTEEPERRIFGHNIFRSKKLSFEPNMNIPTPPDYILGPGDVVIIDIFGASQRSTSVKISPDGSIVIPEEGVFYVPGMTATKAQEKIRSTIGAHYNNSKIRLTLGQTRTIKVNVLGEVNVPGTYAISAFATVFNVLYLSGGVTEIGTLRDVQVSRNGQVIAHVDIYDFIMNGNLRGNIMLQDNDVIRVSPYKNLVEINGKVRRPMFYEMTDEESLQNLIDYAGGFTGDAYKDKVRIERKSEDGLSVHNVAQKEMNSFHPKDGDVVCVEDIVYRYKNKVNIQGAVFRPGNYKLDNSIYSVKTLVNHAGGLLEKAIDTRAVLHRMKEDRTLETHTIALHDIMAGTESDVILKNEDVLFIASKEGIDTLRVLTIQGEVLNPGEYSYSKNEKIEDLIIRAGGLLESASLANVEVARRVTTAEANRDGKSMAQIYSLSLHDGFLVSEDSNFCLEPYDVVTIHRSPDYQEQRVVKIEGEVKYAGDFVLSSKEERLSELIKRAGGLTVNAYAGGIKLTRKVSEEMLANKRLKLETALTAADSAMVYEDLAKDTYLVGVDLEKAIKNPGSLSDIVLVEGDVISIPQLNNTVKISGEVLFQNTVAFERGKKASYYLNQAGGVNKNGSRRHAYILYANGQVSKARWHKPQPGCEIVVPEKTKKEVNPQTVSMWLGMGSTVASIAAVIGVLIK